MEFCLALPAEQKIQRGWTRLIMRRALSGILPAEVHWRSYRGIDEGEPPTLGDFIHIAMANELRCCVPLLAGIRSLEIGIHEFFLPFIRA